MFPTAYISKADVNLFSMLLMVDSSATVDSVSQMNLFTHGRFVIEDISVNPRIIVGWYSSMASRSCNTENDLFHVVIRQISMVHIIA